MVINPKYRGMTMSEEPELGRIRKHFSKVKEPRVDRTKRHKLLDMILIAICGVICGAGICNH